MPPQHTAAGSQRLDGCSSEDDDDTRSMMAWVLAGNKQVTQTESMGTESEPPLFFVSL
jgi:hypothetical protein